ncbi:hypothetical protein BKA66DRAFT_441849 [Pyrenochaeta sp. MPI-SDFR-AT-0127]|nr:hypothetical protein BKA66DRAFT_441849 [Pyrenochaeta sp. MPI-SDFR-AT-0127]
MANFSSSGSYQTVDLAEAAVISKSKGDKALFAKLWDSTLPSTSPTERGSYYYTMTVDLKSRALLDNNRLFPFADASIERDKVSTPLAKPRNLDKFGSKGQGMRGLAFGLFQISSIHIHTDSSSFDIESTTAGQFGLPPSARSRSEIVSCAVAPAMPSYRSLL